MSKFTKEKERNHIYTQECGFWEAACKTDQLKGNKSFFFFTFPGNGYETLAPGDIWIKKRNTHVWEKSNYLHISNPIWEFSISFTNYWRHFRPSLQLGGGGIQPTAVVFLNSISSLSPPPCPHLAASLIQKEVRLSLICALAGRSLPPLPHLLFSSSQWWIQCSLLFLE